jgi:hypothetical protein
MLSYSRVGRSDLDRYFSSSEQARACLRPHLHPTQKSEIRFVRLKQNMPHRGHSFVRFVEGASTITRSEKALGEINKATR